MHSKSLIPALAAVAGLASAQNDPCTADTFTINSNADMSKFSTCRTLKGKVQLGTQTDSQIDLGSIQTIDGDLSCLNNNAITSLKAGFLGRITGDFHLQNLTGLSTLSMPQLKSVGSINFVSLTVLDSLTFTTGVTSASKVVVSDTFLSTLDGLNMLTVGDMNINNNRRLVKWSSGMTNLTGTLNIDSNGLNLQVSLPSLQSVSEMTISNVSSFDVPALSTVTHNMKFFSNFFTTFSAPNLTSTDDGDISFVSNGQLSNITMPVLTSIGGGFLVANNTGLAKLNGFPKLKSVIGAIKLRGSFDEIQFPSLNDVKGAFDAQSTNDIKSSCDVFDKLAPNAGGQIQGNYTCLGKVADANQDTSGTSNGGGGGGKPNSGVSIAINMAGVLGLTALGVVFQAML